MKGSAFLLLCMLAVAASARIRSVHTKEFESEIEGENLIARDVENEIDVEIDVEVDVEVDVEISGEISTTDEPEEEEEEEPEKEDEIELNIWGCPVNTSIHKLLPSEFFCNYFYACDNGFPVLRYCPFSLVFNEKKQVCDWPNKVNCEGKIIGTVPEPEEEEEEEDVNNESYGDPSLAPKICRNKNNIGVLVAHEFCTKFYICDNLGPVAMDCPKGLHFNYNTRQCDWPNNVKCNDRIIPGESGPEHGEVSEVAKLCLSSQSNGLIIPHDNCNRFYVCAGGLPIVFTCPKGLVLNIESGKCDWPQNVDCGQRPIVEDENEEEEEVDHNDTPLFGHNDPSKALEICSKKGSDGVMISHERCGLFYQCWTHNPIEVACPAALYYNPEVGYCDWPTNVQCIDRN